DLWQSINKEFEFFMKELNTSRPIFTVGNNETEINSWLDEYVIAMNIIHAFIDEFTKYIEAFLMGKYSLDKLIKEDDSIKP
ncbi:1007_t:CDS:2, partial [Dentiscutata heterogama]